MFVIHPANTLFIHFENIQIFRMKTSGNSFYLDYVTRDIEYEVFKRINEYRLHVV